MRHPAQQESAMGDKNAASKTPSAGLVAGKPNDSSTITAARSTTPATRAISNRSGTGPGPVLGSCFLNIPGLSLIPVAVSSTAHCSICCKCTRPQKNCQQWRDLRDAMCTCSQVLLRYPWKEHSRGHKQLVVRHLGERVFIRRQTPKRAPALFQAAAEHVHQPVAVSTSRPPSARDGRNPLAVA